MSTIYEVSKLAGVSLATVSRVLNNKGRVTDKTRDKVLKAMADLSYTPNAVAQSLASNCSNSVGLLVPELEGTYFGPIMASVEKELTRSNKHTIITTGGINEQQERNGVEFLVSRQCDAIVLHAEYLSDEYLIELSKKKTIVLLNRFIQEIEENCITLNNHLGGYLATNSLISLGHKTIGYISGPKNKEDSKQRLNGHKEALKEHGLAFNTKLYFEGDYTENAGHQGFKHFLESGIACSAIVCANDELAIGVIREAQSYGFILPEDLSIVGFDNSVYTRYLTPQLTSVDNNAKSIGMMASKFVLKHVYNKNNLVITNMFEPKLVIRNSIAKPKN